MASDKQKVKINSNDIVAYAWRYSEILSKSMSFTDEKKTKLKSDFNIGIDKSNRALFLSKLEFLTRTSVNCYIEIELMEMSDKMPRHLDDKNEYVGYKKDSYKILEIHREEESKSYIRSVGERLVITFSAEDIFRFFTRMYVNFEIYATEYDNKIEIEELSKDDSFTRCELVIWGVYGKEVIYY